MSSLSAKLALLCVVLCYVLHVSHAAESSVIADQFKCQTLRTHNQTKILCHARSNPEESNKARTRYEKDGRVCNKLFQLSQRLRDFEDGQIRYCDPSRCLRESPNCKGGRMTPKCNECLGKCWIMYGYPTTTTNDKLLFKTYPCDFASCGKQVFCGGYDLKSQQRVSGAKSF